ncbi:TPA: hypothetical protein EYP44_04780 [Candidatus Bathyarchaeota archaeon]|nr:hypothetical protein [Candidatus Bathyarchaeota archaeon]
MSLDYKEAINLIESRHPGTKLRVLRSFLKDLKPLVARPEAKLGSCRSCGMPTTAKVCAYCRLALKIEQLT